MTLPLPYILPFFFRKKHMKLKDFAFFRKKNMKLKDNWSAGDYPPNLPKAYRILILFLKKSIGELINDIQASK